MAHPLSESEVHAAKKSAVLKLDATLFVGVESESALA